MIFVCFQELRAQEAKTEKKIEQNTEQRDQCNNL